MRKLPQLGALRVFEAAARRLSFKEAAEELHVTPTAVSHQIKLLEEALGTPLFERGTRKVRLTAAGHQLYPTLRDGFDAFEKAIEGVGRSQGAKTATLSSTVAFIAKRVAPRVGSFRESYPDWTLRLDATNKVADLETEVDAAIRYGSGNYRDLIAETLYQDSFAPVCTPTIAANAKKDLKQVTLIHFEWGDAARDHELAPVWRNWLSRAGRKDIDPKSGLSFTDEIHAVQATVAGQGIGLLSLTLVAEELESGVLVQPFELSLESFKYSLVYSARAAERPATRVLREWVRSQFGKGEMPPSLTLPPATGGRG
jgi:LysR family transcriptional regulator, glycine cleavage system transcriptional activator